MRIWRLIGHHSDPDSAIERFRTHRGIAIGWGKVGDLRRARVAGPTEIAALIRQRYPRNRNAHLGGPSLWRFYDRMQTGDLVILGNGQHRRLVMRIDGEYSWNEDFSAVPGDDYHHLRPASVVLEDPDKLWHRCGSSVARGENARWTLARCS